MLFSGDKRRIELHALDRLAIGSDRFQRRFDVVRCVGFLLCYLGKDVLVSRESPVVWTPLRFCERLELARLVLKSLTSRLRDGRLRGLSERTGGALEFISRHDCPFTVHYQE